MSDNAAVPAWPVVLIALSADRTVEIDGRPVPVDPGRDPREVALAVATDTARSLGRAVRVRAVEPDGTTFPLIVDPQGNVVQGGEPVPAKPSRRGRGLRRGRSDASPRPDHPRAGSPRAGEVRGRPAHSPAYEPSAYEQPVYAEPAHEQPVYADPAHEPPIYAEPAHEPPADEPPALPGPPTDDEPPAGPSPTSAQAHALAVIARALDRGEPDRALIVAKTMARAASQAGDIGAVVATQEIYAYIAVLADRLDLAARLYADALAVCDSHPVDRDGWRDRLAENADRCRARVDLDHGARA
ncbi:hypothetical protein [Embleya scabrispora]|uniref:hypothetical protein n=1 Tax=Embleya scabrispora TaxID=159449 RepID=UPI0003A0B603|nr:hypothetical protein [Embleya scabrispora]MYS87385.1 hypothetical protein [Streptomyces sp. SID5474]